MGAGGGVARHVTDLAFFLISKGCKVTLVYNETLENNLYISKRLEILESCGCNFYVVNFDRSISFKDISACISILKYIIQSNSFDVIHGHSSKGGLYARAAFFLSKAKIIYSPHAFYTMNKKNSFFFNFFLRVVELLLSYFTFRIIITSSSEMKHVNYLKIKKEKSFLVPNGSFKSPLDRQIFISHTKLFLFNFNSKFVIGFVGRFCFQKNAELSIKIFYECFKKIDNLVLLIVGYGEDEKKIKKMINNLGLQEHVVFLENVESELVLPFMDVLLVSSRYEGSPYLFQDACKFGIPIVSTNVGGTEFFVKNNTNGFIFKTKKEAEFAIQKLATNKNLLKRFSKESRNIAKIYSYNRMCESILNIYQI